MKRFLPILFIFVLLLSLFIFLSRSSTQTANAALAGHVVISEVQIGGGTSTDEFVELYNPTSSSVDLLNWTLYKMTENGVSETPIATLSGTINTHGFFLIAHENYDGLVPENITYPATGESISGNNTVLLRDNTSALIDLVGMGTANTSETVPFAQNPIDNRSIERKAFTDSTAVDMASGGAYSNTGNGEDTDNNANDFVRHTSPNLSDPQNVSSPAEDPVKPTITETPTTTPTPSEEPSPTEEPSPSPTGTPTSTPTETPTITPTPTATPTPTDEPTQTPAPTITISTTPTPTVTPIVRPEPRVIAAFPMRNSVRVCTLNYRPFRISFFKMWFPFVSCHTIPLSA